MKIFKITAIIGLFILFGTAGSGDLNTMAAADIAKNLILGSTLLCCGTALAHLTARKPTRVQHPKVIPIEQLRKVG